MPSPSCDSSSISAHESPDRLARSGPVARPVPPGPVIRSAQESDLPAIMAIYNHEITTATSTFDTEPVDLREREAWLRAHQSARHPAIVVVDDDAVLGFATLSKWSDRCAYARAAEVSLYVHRDARGRGFGRLLLSGLVERARAAGVAVLLARIVAESIPSIRLHESLAFQHIGTMRRVGQKFGQILDVELYDLHLDEQP